MLKPASLIIRKVRAFEEPLAFKYPCKNKELAGYKAITSIERKCNSRPAATLISDAGFRNLNKHKIRKIRSGVKFDSCGDRTLPSMGTKRLTGIDSAFKARKRLAT